MTPEPPSGARVLSILARVAVRRFFNKIGSALSRRKKKKTRDGKRTATPPKGRTGVIFTVVFGALFLFNSLMISSNLVRMLSNAAPEATGRDDAPLVVDRSNYGILESAEEKLAKLSDAMEFDDEREYIYSGIGKSLHFRSDHSASGDERAQRILDQFKERGLEGFRKAKRAGVEFLTASDWPAPEEEAPFLRGVVIVMTILFASLICITLGAANQDLGKVEWNMEWLFTMPVSTRSLFTAKVCEYMIVNPFSWMATFPLLWVLARAGGYGWGSVPLALFATLCINAVLGSLRILIETWLRMNVSLSRIKNVQSLCTVLGILFLYAVLYLGITFAAPTWLSDAMRDAPSAILYTPAALPVMLCGSQGDFAILAPALLVTSVLLVFLGVSVATGFVRTGLLRSGGGAYQGKRTARRGTAAGGGLVRGVLGKEFRLLLRDRNFMVQTMVLPIIIIGFQVVINPVMLEAAGENYHHAAMIAFGIGAYVLMAGGASVVSGEGKSFWLLYTVPDEIGHILRRKVRLWAWIGTVYAFIVLALAATWSDAPPPLEDVVGGAIMVVGGLWIYAFISAGLGVLGSNPLEQEVQRRLKPGTIYMYMMLSSMYAYAIYAGEWWSKVSMLVLCSLLAYALWQKVQERVPFLLDPTAAPPPRITLSDGLIASLAFFVLQGVVMAIAFKSVENPTELPTWMITVAFVTSGVIVVISFLIIAASTGVPRLWTTLGLRRVDREAPSAITAIALGSALGMGAAAVAALYLFVMKDTEWFADMQKRAPDLRLIGADAQLWLIGLTVIAAPLFEEFIFRGLVYRGLRRTLGVGLSVFGSAAVFAVVHPVGGWLPVFVLGAAAALAFERTKLLLAPIVAHAVYNGIVVGINLMR